MAVQTVALLQPMGWRRVTWFFLNIRTHGKSVWVTLGVGLMFAIGKIGLALSPVLLLTHPLYLLALNSNGYIVMLCAHEVSWTQIIPIAFARQLVGDPLTYLMGKYNVDSLTSPRERPTSGIGLIWWWIRRPFAWMALHYALLLAHIQRWVGSLGILGVLVWPSAAVMYTAGFSRLNSRWVAMADVVSAALRLWLMASTPFLVAQAVSAIS